MTFRNVFFIVPQEILGHADTMMYLYAHDKVKLTHIGQYVLNH